MKIAALMIASGTLLTAGVALANLPVQNAGSVVERWSLRQFEGRSVKHGNPEAVTLRFLANNRMVGTAACNDVGGDELTWSADLAGTKGIFARNQAGATIITTAVCANASSMRTGSQFWTRMSGARYWSLRGKSLTIEFADGATALLMPLSAKGAVSAAYSWGKPGVSRSNYDADAVSCSLKPAARDVGGDSETKAYVRGFDVIERENNMPPMARPIDDDGLIAQSNRNVLLRRMYKPERKVDALQNKLQSEVEACLISHGYTRFMLSKDQSRQLDSFKIGSLARRDFLHRLGSNAAIVAGQRANATDH